MIERETQGPVLPASQSPGGFWPCDLPRKRNIIDTCTKLCAQELVGNLSSRSVASSLGRELEPCSSREELCSCTYLSMCICTLYMYMLLSMSLCRLMSNYLEGEVMVSDTSEVLCLYDCLVADVVLWGRD